VGNVPAGTLFNWNILQGGVVPLKRNWKPARAGDSDRAVPLEGVSGRTKPWRKLPGSKEKFSVI